MPEKKSDEAFQEVFAAARNLGDPGLRNIFADLERGLKKKPNLLRENPPSLPGMSDEELRVLKEFEAGGNAGFTILFGPFGNRGL